MGFKSKVLGLFAALALTLSMGVGIASAQSVGGSVVLEPGTCAFGPLSGTSMTFGNWAWNGNSYTLDSGGNSDLASISGSTTSYGPSGCTVTIKSNGLKLNNANIIDGTHFETKIVHKGTDYGWHNAGHPINSSLSNVQQGSFSLYIRLKDVPNTLQPGSYTGTVTFTISNTAP